ncbi:MAG TPA: FtsX-like permease family protein [Gammaproteobacteria bacterium]|nr:FtsX-like permease family protein [Gammaproteobacteria bacterium]
MDSLKQAAVVTAMNLRSLGARRGTSLVAIVGIAGVVAVLIGIFSISAGFDAVLALAGADDVAIVMRGGTNTEMTSGLSQEQTRIIADAPGVVHESGEPVASAELYVLVDVALKDRGTPANVPLRGVGTHAASLRKGFTILEGRTFRPGTNEVIVGRGVAQQNEGLEVGKILRNGQREWSIVGIFGDSGSVAESEIWSDAIVLQGAYNRGTSYQSTRVRLESAAALQTFKDALTSDPRLNVRVFTERQYYAEQSRTLVTLVTVVGQTIAVLMGLAAVFGALNTMYSAVSARTREIATLRAMGFGAVPVVTSVLVEAMLLGAIGGAAGALIAYYGFNGVRASTMNLSSFSQITFAFKVTPALVVQSLLYALVLGFFGGLMPSLRAARQPITAGLRDS